MAEAPPLNRGSTAALVASIVDQFNTPTIEHTNTIYRAKAKFKPLEIFPAHRDSPPIAARH